MDNKSQVREKKKAQFSEGAQPGASGKKKTTVILIAVLIAVVGVGAYLVLSASSNNPASTSVATSSTTAGSRDIVIPISDVSNTAKFFDYKLSDSKPVRFFVLKSSDGQYRA